MTDREMFTATIPLVKAACLADTRDQRLVDMLCDIQLHLANKFLDDSKSHQAPRQ